MKNNKILLAGVTTALILGLGTTSIYAYEGNGEGRGQGYGRNLSDTQREKIQNMTTEERQEYMKENKIERGQGKKNGEKDRGGEHNPGTMIADIPNSDLTDKEKEILSYGYSEEMVARDAYNYLYELYGEETFKRIADSEQKHMDAVEVLLDRYELDIPTGYGDLQSTFDELKAEGEKGLKEAIEVGIQIEILDIEDIDDAIKNTDNDDFKVVFTNIGGASYNHLRSFLKALDNNDMETDIDWSDFLSEKDLDSKGPLAYKLAERLENEGIELPNQVSSDEMKNRKKSTKSKGNSSNREVKKINNRKGGVNQSLKNKYTKTIKAKYQSKIDALDEDKLSDIVIKIDDLADKISESTKYKESTKDKYLVMLGALKDIILEKIGEENIDLDGLFD